MSRKITYCGVLKTRFHYGAKFYQPLYSQLGRQRRSRMIFKRANDAKLAGLKVVETYNRRLEASNGSGNNQ